MSGSQPRGEENLKGVQLAQMDIRAHGTSLEAGKEVLGRRFDNHSVTNQVVCFLLDGPLPALLGRSGSELNQSIQSVLLGAIGHARIGASEIGFGDLEVEVRLANGFVPGIEDRDGFRSVFGAQTLLFPAFSVLDVEHAAKLAPVKGETVLHSSDFLV